MRKIAKLISLFYGCQMLLGSLGMALYCCLDPNAFGSLGKGPNINLWLFFLTAGVVSQVGLGLLMLWLGMPRRGRRRTWLLARTAVKQFVEN